MHARKFYKSIINIHCHVIRNRFSLCSLDVGNHDSKLFSITKYLFPLFGTINRCLSSQGLKFCSEVEEAINKQINAEQQAAQDYLSIAVLFLHPSISRSGASNYFMKMYLEELNHMEKFIHYQIMRGGMPQIKGIKEPRRLANITLLSAFEQALTIENNVTQHLENLVCVADSVKDYQCSEFVTSVFLREQRLALSEIAHHITKLLRFGVDEHALYHYDLHLANSLNVHNLEPKLKEI